LGLDRVDIGAADEMSVAFHDLNLTSFMPTPSARRFLSF
jgi:hypothetical protein